MCKNCDRSKNINITRHYASTMIQHQQHSNISLYWFIVSNIWHPHLAHVSKLLTHTYCFVNVRKHIAEKYLIIKYVCLTFFFSSAFETLSVILGTSLNYYSNLYINIKPHGYISSWHCRESEANASDSQQCLEDMFSLLHVLFLCGVEIRSPYLPIVFVSVSITSHAIHSYAKVLKEREREGGGGIIRSTVFRANTLIEYFELCNRLVVRDSYCNHIHTKFCSTCYYQHRGNISSRFSQSLLHVHLFM